MSDAFKRQVIANFRRLRLLKPNTLQPAHITSLRLQLIAKTREALDVMATQKKLSLSSNWKELQKTLKRKEPTSTVTDAASPPVAKRTKIEKKAATAKKTVNGTTTTPSSSSTFTPSASLALWAEDNDISPEDLARAYGTPATSTTALADSNKPLVFMSDDPTTSKAKEKDIGRYVAIDCEMVGVGGPDHERSALARVSIVNFHGHCVVDLFVKPKEKVTDWRTWVSGVTPAHMEKAVDFETAQKIVADILKGRILIGHALKNDFDALLLSHPRPDTRDTSTYSGFREMFSVGKKHTVGLKRLAKEILKIDIQGGKHSSIEDARACMLLYRKHKGDFEKEHAKKFPHKNKQEVKAEMKAKAKKKEKAEMEEKLKSSGEATSKGEAKLQAIVSE